VRRLVVLFGVALIGVSAFGLSTRAGGVRVNGEDVSGSTMRAELAAIAASPTLQCYLSALSASGLSAGAGGDTLAAAGAAAWVDARVQGMTIASYVTTTLHHVVTAADMASAQASLELEMTQQVAAQSRSCPGTSAQAVAAMTPEMRNAELRDWSASLYLEAKLNSTVPLTTAGFQTYFQSHQSNYDTLCISIALVSPTQVSAFGVAQGNGESVAQLASKFSVDTASAKNGGAYGCYGPTSTSYSSIRADVSGQSLNVFPATPHYVSLSQGTYALYVAITKRSPTPFAQAEPLVVSDVRSQNASSANGIEKSLEYQAAVYVDPAMGRWGLDSTGPRVFAPALPSTSTVLGATSLRGTPANYQ